ncbi:MAG: thioredoxin fold domain-containing protein [Candidatus Obscuribacterales bacterium]|nr:thioredoxin fold domain-containing protein [Candidatus Obscuribacterales bacterium]
MNNDSFRSTAFIAKGSLLAALLITACFAQPFALAQTNKLRDQAINDYNASRYRQATDGLQSFLKTNPNDEVAHYYLAMCYQQTSNPKAAIKEYIWVENQAKDSGLVANAQKGLIGLGEKPTRALPQANLPKGKRPQVIDFSATWCGPCRRFAPTFDRIAASYRGKVDFIHADVEDAKFKKLTDQYKIRLLPTLVFRKADGTTTLMHEGVPDEQTVIKQTERLLK